jgi:glycolate oxidase FAD binding subunit
VQVPELVAAVLAQAAEPSAIEVDLGAPAGGRATALPPGSLAVLLEGSPVAVTARADQVAKALGRAATVSPKAPRWWGRYPFTGDDVVLRVSAPVADLHAAVYALRDAAGMPVPVRGSAGRGSVHAVLPGTLSTERVEGIVDAVRGVLLGRGGRCVVITAPSPLNTEIDMAARPDLF